MTARPRGSTSWLVDKFALARLGHSAQADAWAERINRGLVRITTVTLLEIGYSARSATDLRSGLASPPIAAMPVEYFTPAIEDGAVQVLAALADRGQHRAPSIPDLLVAAVVEHAGLTVLYLDKDFELIADITRQPIERLTLPRFDLPVAASVGSDSDQSIADHQHGSCTVPLVSRWCRSPTRWRRADSIRTATCSSMVRPALLGR